MAVGGAVKSSKRGKAGGRSNNYLLTTSTQGGTLEPAGRIKDTAGLVGTPVQPGSLSVSKFRGNRANIPLIENIPKDVPWVDPQMVMDFTSQLMDTSIEISAKKTAADATNGVINFSEEARDLLYHPKTGLLYTEGKGTVEAMEVKRAEMDALVQKHLGSLDPAARSLALGDIMSTKDSYMKTMSRYTAEQYNVYEQRTAERNRVETIKKMKDSLPDPATFVSDSLALSEKAYPKVNDKLSVQNSIDRQALFSDGIIEGFNEVARALNVPVDWRTDSIEAAEARHVKTIDHLEQIVGYSAPYLTEEMAGQLEGKVLEAKNLAVGGVDRARENESKQRAAAQFALTAMATSREDDGSRTYSKEEFEAELDRAFNTKKIADKEPYRKKYRNNGEHKIDDERYNELRRRADHERSTDPEKKRLAAEAISEIEQNGSTQQNTQLNNARKTALNEQEVTYKQRIYSNLEREALRLYPISELTTMYDGTKTENANRTLAVQDARGQFDELLREENNRKLDDPNYTKKSFAELQEIVLADMRKYKVELMQEGLTDAKIEELSPQEKIELRNSYVRALNGKAPGIMGVAETIEHLQNYIDADEVKAAEAKTAAETHEERVQQDTEAREKQREQDIEDFRSGAADPGVQPGDEEGAAATQARRTIGALGGMGDLDFGTGQVATPAEAPEEPTPIPEYQERIPPLILDPQDDPEFYTREVDPYVSPYQLNLRTSWLTASNPDMAPELITSGTELMKPDINWEDPAVRRVAFINNLSNFRPTPGYLMVGVNNLLAMANKDDNEAFGETPDVTRRQIFTLMGKALIRGTTLPNGERRPETVGNVLDKAEASFSILQRMLEDKAFKYADSITYLEQELNSIWQMESQAPASEPKGKSTSAKEYLGAEGDMLNQ